MTLHHQYVGLLSARERALRQISQDQGAIVAAEANARDAHLWAQRILGAVAIDFVVHVPRAPILRISRAGIAGASIKLWDRHTPAHSFAFTPN